jgi:hypothetical protein
MTGVEIKDWVESGLLGLITVALIWVVKDYLNLRTKILPQFVTEAQCTSCRAAKSGDMKEIRERLNAGQ